MERLNEGAIELNDIEVFNNCSYSCYANLADALNKLKVYEDTGLEPEDVRDLKDCIEGEEGTEGTVSDLIELMKYRKLEAEGRLIKLPPIQEKRIEFYQGQCVAAESMLNDIYKGEIIGETAYNVISQALQSMKEMIAERVKKR